MIDQEFIRRLKELENRIKFSPTFHKEYKEILTDRTVRTDKTRIGHSLGKTPTEIVVMPKTEATWWMVQRSDDKFIYLQASTDVTCDIVVRA